MRRSDGLIIYRYFIGLEPSLSTEDGTLPRVGFLLAFFFGLFGAKSEFHLTTTPLRESHLPARLPTYVPSVLFLSWPVVFTHARFPKTCIS